MDAAVIAVELVLGLCIILLTVRQNRLDQRLVELEERREEQARRDRQSADLRAHIFRMPRGGTSATHRLVVENKGPAAARNVHVELDGQPVADDHRASSGGAGQDITLAAGSSISWELMVAAQDPDVGSIRMCWDDDAGGDEVETTVGFPA